MNSKKAKQLRKLIRGLEDGGQKFNEGYIENTRNRKTISVLADPSDVSPVTVDAPSGATTITIDAPITLPEASQATAPTKPATKDIILAAGTISTAKGSKRNFYKHLKKSIK